MICRRTLTKSPKWKDMYGRSPKVWSIEQLYNLWVKSMNRRKKYKKQLDDLIVEICENAPKSSWGNPIFYKEEDGIVYEQNLMETTGDENEYKLYRGNPLSKFDREATINFLLHEEQCLDYGERYHRYLNLSETVLSFYVKNYLDYSIENILRWKFRNDHPPEILTISIGGDEFYVKSKHHPDNRFIEYELMNKCSDSPIIKI